MHICKGHPQGGFLDLIQFWLDAWRGAFQLVAYELGWKDFGANEMWWSGRNPTAARRAFRAGDSLVIHR